MNDSLCTCGHLPHIFACWGDNGECACREHAAVQKVDDDPFRPMTREELTALLIALQYKVAHPNERTTALKNALFNMLVVAKADEWDKASTGRQIIYRNAEEVLARG